jgi:methionine synthase II (cobalamin-independent)
VSVPVPSEVHLVGSIGLDSVDEVFTTVGRTLGKRLKRVPDGEQGPRRLWISFQYPMLLASPFLRPDPGGAHRKNSGFRLLVLADGVRPAEIRFGELGYAREARASYDDFCAARERGDLPKDVRFQVCLPTPMAVIRGFCTGQDIDVIEAAYERAMVREAEAICRAIPHRDLCIQWDVCYEMIAWDGQPQDFFPPITVSKEQIIAPFARLCAAVVADVELGFHLCYGDFGAKHAIEPKDAGKLVEISNALAKAAARPVAYIHMPVPIARNDDAYYAPLRDLKLGKDTKLYLGVVHAADGADGTKQRIAAASKYASGFGIATECGMARQRTPELVKQLLGVHAACSQEPSH